MSKIGNTPVTVVPGATVEISDSQIVVKGPEGMLSVPMPVKISVKQDGDMLIVERSTNDKKTRAMHGLVRKLIANAVEGVTKRFEKKLEIVGTGYNVKMQGAGLQFKLGYSHTIDVQPAEGIRFAVEGNNLITVSGIDKQLVGQVAQQLYVLRKPDAYKGKGVRYQGQQIKLKPGKKAKA